MANLKIIKADKSNIRLDQYLSEYFKDISRNKISKLIKNKEVEINNKFEKSSYLINLGDIIKINLESLDITPLKAQNLDISIIYKDEDIAIINKPYGIISHPTEYIRENTVVNFLLANFDELPSLYDENRLGIVHRLDKDTSGLMIIALNQKSLEKLYEMFKKHEVIKKYRAIVVGNMPNTEDIIEGYIKRSEKNRKLRIVSDNGKYSKTSYKLLEYKNGYSYLDLILHTGRTHQIRVHLSSINHPILGDQDYNNIKSKYNVSRQLLQAYELEFNHPISGKKMKFTIDPYPEFLRYYNIIFNKGENL